MYAIIGVAIGIAIHFLIIKPIEVRNARKWCKEHGLISDESEGR
jgi:hypothetical protein